jgi:hypothetical protein
MSYLKKVFVNSKQQNVYYETVYERVPENPFKN